MKDSSIRNAEKDTKDIVKAALVNPMTYESFKALVKELALNGGTTGPEQTDAYKHYTVLNDRRMKRWDKTFKLSEEQQRQVKAFNKKVIWLVITESWCGDAAPTLPVMNKVSQVNQNIQLKIVLRNEHPELMDHFHTGGKLSIPKLIMIHEETNDVLDTWGPLPSIAKEIAADYKAANGQLTAAFKEELQQWFNADKGQNTLKDLTQLLRLE
ncbi:MAG: thioredoxin family protein [Eudoraea sp.]|nr:thioredoxin family protein [Eudoraea sp.]